MADTFQRPGSVDELRTELIRDLDAMLEGPWLLRLIGPERRRLVRALRRYWMGADVTELAALMNLLNEEP